MGKPFKIERIADMFRPLWSWDAAGTCHHRRLTDDMKHQVALNAYELDVFSIAGPPPAKNEGVWGALPPSQNKKFENISKHLRNKIEEKTIC